MKKAFITGATGFLGGHLASRLVNEGYEVTCMVRKSSNLQWLEDLPLNYVYGDISKITFEAADALKDAELVFHLAGIVHPIRNSDFYRINGEAAGEFAALCAKNCKNLRRFVLVSSLAAVGSGEGSKAASDLQEPAPMSEYGKSKRLGEIKVLEHSSKIPVSIVRPSVIFGPRDKDTLQFFKMAKFGIVPIIGGGGQRIAMVYIDNVIDALMLAALKEEAIGKAFLLGDGENLELQTAMAYIQQVVGKKGVPIPVPGFALLGAGLALDILSKIIGKPFVLGYDKAKEALHKNWAVDDSLARELLGYKCRIGVQRGIELAYNWYKAKNWL